MRSSHTALLSKPQNDDVNVKCKSSVWSLLSLTPRILRTAVTNQGRNQFLVHAECPIVEVRPVQAIKRSGPEFGRLGKKLHHPSEIYVGAVACPGHVGVAGDLAD